MHESSGGVQTTTTLNPLGEDCSGVPLGRLGAVCAAGWSWKHKQKVSLRCLFDFGLNRPSVTALAMHLQALLACVLATVAFCQQLKGVVNQFTADPGVEFENIAVRSNGVVLVTAVGRPFLFSFSLNPRRSFVSELPPFPGVASLFGIGEIAPDLFVVAGGNLGRGVPNVPGSFSVFAINVGTFPETISKIADFPQAGILNGLTVIPGRAGTNATVLLSDTFNGTIYVLNPSTGKYSTAFPRLSAAKTSPLVKPGINGIRYVSSTRTLFYANTIDAVFGSVKINVGTRKDTVPAVTAAENPRTIASNVSVDDFAAPRNGTVVAAANPANSVISIGARGQITTLVSGANLTSLKAPTSAAWGRKYDDLDSVYVTSGGLPLSENGTSPGGVLFELKF
ncbi:hypothetical protein CAC42_4869 [Sphaceloma murrayae]|uniref:Uncharacterized protein n=1 Tax=Sphaceloma murrayae TaxID=2082308 RepID=A0A2K1QP84_9PEZI|nr:hypothetical protein CAC42_4869 [Sphaceloma murrayae]